MTENKRIEVLERRKMIRGFENKFEISPKVLLCAPYYDGKAYVFKDYLDNLRNINYPNYDVLMMDNSEKWEQSKDLLLMAGLKEEEYQHSEHIPTTRHRQRLAYQKLREYFLENDYDYMFIVETDLLPPPSIIQDLMINDKDIVGAVYLIGLDYASRLPCVTTGFFQYTTLGFKETFAPFYDIDGELKKLQGGCGLGCTLIKKEVLAKLDFRTTDVAGDPTPCHADTYYHRDAHRLGFETWVDTRFMIPHYPSPYPPNDF